MRMWGRGFLVFLIFAAIFAGIFLVSSFTSAAPATPAPAAITVYGQPNFATARLFTTGPDSLKNASALISDAHGGFYVADYGNSRVLHFPSTKAHGKGPQADRVYGQPDFFSSRPDTGTTGLNYPHGVAIGPYDDLYISDMFNNRILHYSPHRTTADHVYGQPDFILRAINTGGLSAHSLYQPQGIAVDASGIYVADTGNNRVLHFPLNKADADRVYGQGTLHSFTSKKRGAGPLGLNQPRDVVVDKNGIYVADSGNQRIVHFSTHSASADFVYGQKDLSPRSFRPNQGHRRPSAITLWNPTGLALDAQSGLYVADRDNNRVLYFPPRSATTRNGSPATRVYGQSNFTVNGKNINARSFNGPGSVSLNRAGQLFVLDIFNQRVLRFAL